MKKAVTITTLAFAALAVDARAFGIAGTPLDHSWIDGREYTPAPSMQMLSVNSYGGGGIFGFHSVRVFAL